MRTRTYLVVALLLAAAGLAGCSQARCVWDNTRDGVKTAFSAPDCCPGPDGTVLTGPVYDVGPGTGTTYEGRGAFATPRTP